MDHAPEAFSQKCRPDFIAELNGVLKRGKTKNSFHLLNVLLIIFLFLDAASLSFNSCSSNSVFWWRVHVATAEAEECAMI